MTNYQLIKYFLLFVISFLLFSYFQHFPTFPDPDSFYHAKVAVLIRDHGIIKNFPWLEFTVLKNYYIDHHLLYHLLLVPFVIFLDPLVGVKLATALFAALSILIFYWFLENQKIRGAFFYSLLLLINYPFIFRINLIKASSLAVIILFLGLYFIFKQKYWALFVLSFIYVWTHAGWPLIFILTVFYILGDSLLKTSLPTSNIKIKNQISKIKNTNQKIKKYFNAFYLCILYSTFYILFLFHRVFTKENLKLISACFGGLAAGIIINPYFPTNLLFYWYQIVKIAIINYKDKISVGAEWYSHDFSDLISNASLVFVLLIIAFSALFISFLKRITNETTLNSNHNSNKTETLTLFLIFCFFFILTLRSRRNVEYWSPFAILFSAFLINNYLPYKFEELISKFKNILRRKKFLTIAVSLYFLIILPCIISKDLIIVKNNYQEGNPVDKYKGASEWLAKNTPVGSIIFHNDWDDFPPLFYYNTHNHYIAGLDPTFMYEYNKELHKKWIDSTTTKWDDISQIIKNDFHAEYVFVDKDYITLENNLKRDRRFKMVYKDDEGKIYQLIEL